MALNPGFKIGEQVTHSDIIKTFKCGNMGGMLPSNTTNTMVIISDYTKGLYHDKWKDGVLHYTGTGKAGDQQLSSNPGYKNGILYNSKTNGIEIHLFEVLKGTAYMYCGVVELDGIPYQEIQKDENGNDRKVWMFPMKPVEGLSFKTPDEYTYIDGKTVKPKKEKKIVNKSIQLKIEEFNKVVHDRDDQVEELRKKFVNDYNIHKLEVLKKEEYVYGLGRQDTFCYRVAHELRQLGSIRNGTPTKYGFYFGGFGKDQEQKYRTVSAFGKDDTPEAADNAFFEVKRAIGLLLVAGTSNNYEAIEKNSLSTIFKGKLLCIYFPDQYLNVYSIDHVHFFMDNIGIEYEQGTGIMKLLQDMIAWKNNNPVAKEWTNYEFSKFLYSVIGYPPQAEKIKKEIDKYEKKIDQELIEEIDDVPKDELPLTIDYNPEPVDRPDPVIKEGNVSYQRNKDVALKALKRANYQCEIEVGHPSFIRKSNATNYTEPHHLVPMAEQDRFAFSLDVPANIISLCSNCHNRLHYGQDPEIMLKQLYEARESELTAAGIVTTYEDLIAMYK